jgi:hypothetical protein
LTVKPFARACLRHSSDESIGTLRHAAPTTHELEQPEEPLVKSQNRRAWRKRLSGIYWALVGLIGLGQPIVDRRSMYGDDPTNDPRSLEFDRVGRSPSSRLTT